jgi:outer membrane scaffolding protein for murein synthesis (MipA/OmpV family)
MGRFLLYLVGTWLIFGLGGTAMATATGDWFPDEILAPTILEVSEKRQSDTFVDVGVAVLSQSSYLGRSKTNVKVYPYAAAEYKGRWFVNPSSGAGVNLINKRPVVLSASIDYNSGRKAEDTPFAHSAFDLDPGASIRVGGRYRFKYGAIGSQVHLPVAGDIRGMRGSTRIGTLIPLTGELKISPSAKVSYQSGKSLSAQYGLNSAQAAAAGLAPVNFDGGISSYEVTMALYWRNKSKNFQVLGGASYRQLAGDLRDSPLVDDPDSVFVGAGFARRY